MGWLSGLAGAVGGISNLFGSGAQSQAYDQAASRIGNLPGMTSQGIGGNFGSVSAGGNFVGSDQFQGMQDMLGGGSKLMMGGGMYNDQNLQGALQANNMAGALGQANQGFGAQAGNTAFGNMGGMMGSLQGQLGQDFSGGMMGNVFGQGMANQAAAGDQSALFNQSLDLQRQAAAPELARQQQSMENSLFGKGMFGANSTQTGDAYRGLFQAQGAQDLAMQNNAFGQANQQQQFLAGLGGQQMGQGQQFLGQNMGQYNNTIQNMMGLEGQGFGQNLQGMGFNAQQGQNRLQSAMGLFGLGADTFNTSYGLGLQGANTNLGYNQLGLDAAKSPAQLQAQLLQGGGMHAQAYGNMAGGAGAAKQGMFGGVGDAIGGIVDMFS